MTMFGRVNRNREAIIKLVIIGTENRKIAADAVSRQAQLSIR
jgi:hypothetical protein